MTLKGCYFDIICFLLHEIQSSLQHILCCNNKTIVAVYVNHGQSLDQYLQVRRFNFALYVTTLSTTTIADNISPSKHKKQSHRHSSGVKTLGWYYYVIDNVQLEFITGFTVTRGVVESIIQHEAPETTSPSAVSPVMDDKNAQCVLQLVSWFWIICIHT